MNVTTQDILTLTQAYACIRAAKDRRGRELKDEYGDDILEALTIATVKYKKVLQAGEVQG